MENATFMPSRDNRPQKEPPRQMPTTPSPGAPRVTGYRSAPVSELVSRLNAARQPTDAQLADPLFIRSGRIPSRVVLDAALKDPAKLESWIKMGLPTKSYANLMRDFLDNGNHAADFKRTLSILKHAGHNITWPDMDRAQHRLSGSNYIALIRAKDGATSDPHRMAWVLSQNHEMAREVAQSRVLGDQQPAFEHHRRQIRLGRPDVRPPGDSKPDLAPTRHHDVRSTSTGSTTPAAPLMGNR